MDHTLCDICGNPGYKPNVRWTVPYEGGTLDFTGAFRIEGHPTKQEPGSTAALDLCPSCIGKFSAQLAASFNPAPPLPEKDRMRTEQEVEEERARRIAAYHEGFLDRATSGTARLFEGASELSSKKAHTVHLTNGHAVEVESDTYADDGSKIIFKNNGVFAASFNREFVAGISARHL